MMVIDPKVMANNQFHQEGKIHCTNPTRINTGTQWLFFAKHGLHQQFLSSFFPIFTCVKYL